MEKLTIKTESIMAARFGRDSVIALATEADGIPHVRMVNALYDKGAFYVLTHRLSGKMEQIAGNPVVAVAGEWFSAHGRAVDRGYFGKAENRAAAEKMREAFSGWIDNGHNDLDDINTIILAVELTDGVLLSRGERYEIDFTRR